MNPINLAGRESTRTPHNSLTTPQSSHLTAPPLKQRERDVFRSLLQDVCAGDWSRSYLLTSSGGHCLALFQQQMDPDQWHEVRFCDESIIEIFKIFHPKIWPFPQEPVQLPGPTPQPVPRPRPHIPVKVGSVVAGDARLGGRSPALRAPGGIPFRIHREAQRHHYSWLVCSLGRSILILM